MSRTIPYSLEDFGSFPFGHFLLMAKEPQSRLFRILRFCFKFFIIVSSFILCVGIFTIVIGLLALRDEQSHRERSAEDFAALKLVIATLFVTVSLGILQIIVGCLGIRKLHLRFLWIYFIFDIVCLILWLFLALFSENQSGPFYSFILSVFRVITTYAVIFVVRHETRKEKKSREAERNIPAMDGTVIMPSENQTITENHIEMPRLIVTNEAVSQNNVKLPSVSEIVHNQPPKEAVLEQKVEEVSERRVEERTEEVSERRIEGRTEEEVRTHSEEDEEESWETSSSPEHDGHQTSQPTADK